MQMPPHWCTAWYTYRQWMSNHALWQWHLHLYLWVRKQGWKFCSTAHIWWLWCSCIGVMCKEKQWFPSWLVCPCCTLTLRNGLVWCWTNCMVNCFQTIMDKACPLWKTFFPLFFSPVLISTQKDDNDQNCLTQNGPQTNGWHHGGFPFGLYILAPQFVPLCFVVCFFFTLD